MASKPGVAGSSPVVRSHENPVDEGPHGSIVRVQLLYRPEIRSATWRPTSSSRRSSRRSACSRTRAVKRAAALRWLHLVEGEVRACGRTPALASDHPLVVLLERDVWIVRVRDPDRPIYLAFDLLRLRLPKDDPITTNLDRLLGLVGDGTEGGRGWNQRIIEAPSRSRRLRCYRATNRRLEGLPLDITSRIW